MSSKLRVLATAVCPGMLLLVVLSFISNLSTWRRTDVELPLSVHVPAASRDTWDTLLRPTLRPKDTAAVAKKGVPQVRYSGSCKGDSLCMNHLSPSDVKRFRQCVEKVREYNITKIENGTCRFISRKGGRGNVALASFPGSGNTWVRSLLESATGVCTGAFVCDISLRARGFAGDYIQSGSVLVVKTHRFAPFWYGERKPSGLHNIGGVEASYTAAIVLVRNPFDALTAEWNRIVSNGFHEVTMTLDSHAQKAGKEWFGNNTKWNGFIIKKAKIWQAMIKNWVLDGMKKHPVIVVRYEDLKQDTFTEVKRMLGFLVFDYDAVELKAKLDRDFTTFHRKHEDSFDPFTLSQKAYIRRIVREITTLADQQNLSSTLRLSEYLDPS